MIETPFEDLIYPNYDYIYQVANFDDVAATFVLQHPARLLKGHTPAPWEVRERNNLREICQTTWSKVIKSHLAINLIISLALMMIYGSQHFLQSILYKQNHITIRSQSHLNCPESKSTKKTPCCQYSHAALYQIQVRFQFELRQLCLCIARSFWRLIFLFQFLQYVLCSKYKCSWYHLPHNKNRGCFFCHVDVVLMTMVHQEFR